MAFFWGWAWLWGDMTFLSQALAGHSLEPAIEDGGESWCYQDLAERADRIAGELRRAGVRPGDRVSVLGTLDRETVANLHGIWIAGASVVPLNARWTPAETRRALELLSPDLMLGEEGKIRGRHRNGSAIPNGGETQGCTHPGREAPAAGDSGTREAAFLLTSGTSGQPRGVGITVRNLQASAEASAHRLRLDSGDRWLASLSPAHIGGLALVTRAALLGSSLVLRGPFRVDDLASVVREGSVTHASLVPTMLYRLLKVWDQASVPRSLRCLLVGGAAAGRSLIEAASSAGFPVSLTYGLTEASSQVATAPPDLVRKKPGTVGLPLPGVDVRITTEGEVLVRGPTVAPMGIQEDGWLHTGDLGWEDEEGHLWIRGRISDVINSGGVNIHPGEVQDILEAHPRVREAVVFGLQDEEWGERVAAGVVCEGSSAISEEEVRAWVRERLSGAKTPRAVRCLPAIPRNANGKVDRDRLRAYFQ